MTLTSLDLSGIGMTSQRTRTRLVNRLRDEGIKNERVLAAVEQTPRHIFIDEAMSHRAYEDTALPIGMGQTISQPYIVARMTEALLQAASPKNVLEIGTGCGYQTAILSQLVDQVYTIERIGQLQEKAKQRLSMLGCHNVRYLWGDGFLGWEQHAPYDAIIVTAAPEFVPQDLLEQLALGGCLIIPVGGQTAAQQLKLIQRTEEGFDESLLEDVRFVPLLVGKQ